MAGLEVQGLSFTYPGAAAATLQDIDFSVASGDSLALLGSSGAGKTTLLNLLSGLLPCTEGRILFDGVDIAPLAAGRRGVAQVFQFPVLYDSLDVRDNIAFGLRTRGVGKQERGMRASAIAELFDLTSVLTVKPADLSLFQKQLVGFAKALVRDDLAMVLLDEPLTAVEPAMKWRLRGIVKQAQAELGVTMVYVTHDQTEALTFADEVSVLHDGRLLQTGTPAALYSRPEHAEVARFIGSPGMNLLAGELRDGVLFIAGVEVAGQLPGLDAEKFEIGFRPEWGKLGTLSLPPDQVSGQQSQLTMPATVLAQRLTGGTARKALGMVELAVGGGSAQVACELDDLPQKQVELQLEQYQIFVDGWRTQRGAG